MFDEEPVKKPRAHEVGMPIETMSVEELGDRIEILKAEIVRLEEAVAARKKTKAAADSLFKF
jgi:uncharacterized small protein (DUF1192 family)